MADLENMGNVFDRSVKRWTKVTVFMRAFIAREISSLRFTHKNINFVGTCMDEIAAGGIVADEGLLRMKQENFHKQTFPTLRLFLHLRPLLVMRLIAESIAEKDTSSEFKSIKPFKPSLWIQI